MCKSQWSVLRKMQLKKINRELVGKLYCVF